MSDSPQLKLYEITNTITYATVVLAVSDEDALEHVASWRTELHNPGNADLVGFDSTELSDERALEVPLKDWDDEAHVITEAASKLISKSE